MSPYLLTGSRVRFRFSETPGTGRTGGRLWTTSYSSDCRGMALKASCVLHRYHRQRTPLARPLYQPSHHRAQVAAQVKRSFRTQLVRRSYRKLTSSMVPFSTISCIGDSVWNCTQAETETRFLRYVGKRACKSTYEPPEKPRSTSYGNSSSFQDPTLPTTRETPVRCIARHRY